MGGWEAVRHGIRVARAVEGGALNEPALSHLGLTLDPIRGGQFHCAADNYRRASVTIDEARILAAAASGRRVLEFGTGLGVSTLYMAQLARQLVTIDPDPWVHETVRLPSHVVRCWSFHDVPPGGFDLAFIDGNHDEASVECDLYLAKRRMASGDVVAFHDSGQDGVRSALTKHRHLFDASLVLPTVGRLVLMRLA